MPKHSTIDSISRTLEVLKLMVRENGATVTEISKATGIDRWTVRDMIDRMEDLAPNGKGLRIEEFQSKADKRETRYRVPKSCLWTITIPGLNLESDEALFLAMVFAQGAASPMMKDTANSLKKKLNLFQESSNYEIINASSVKKITRPISKDCIIALLDAAKSETCMGFTYKPVNKEESKYQVVPLGIFKYEDCYYLASQKLPEGEYRTFSIERIIDMPQPVNYKGQLPLPFDFRASFNDPFGPFNHGQSFEAVLKFDSTTGFYNLEKKWPKSVSLEQQNDKTVIMKARTESKSGIIHFIMGFGTGVEVLEPQWLRDEICKEHKKAAELYKTKKQAK